MHFRDLLTRHAVIATEKQYRLAEIVGDRPWRLSLDEGLLGFGDDLAWSIEVLGTESHESGTWLWAWGNEALDIPAGMLTGSNGLRQYGREHQLAELEERTCRLELATGYALATVGSGLLDAVAYYRAPFDHGAVYVLVTDADFPRERAPSAARMIDAVRKAVRSFDVDHALAIAAYAEQRGGTLTRHEHALALSFPRGPRLRIDLDGNAQVSRIESLA